LNNSLTNGSFIEPRYIPRLEKEGLYDYEIAASLGVDVGVVRKRLRQGAWDRAKHWSDQVVLCVVRQELHDACSSSYMEREFNIFALTTAAAEVFVARLENNVGDGYLDFLFNYDDKVKAYGLTEEISRNMAHIQEMDKSRLLEHYSRCF
jgi:hypothetical protein